MQSQYSAIEYIGRGLATLTGMLLLATIVMFAGLKLFEHFTVALALAWFTSIVAAYILPLPIVWPKLTRLSVRCFAAFLIFALSIVLWFYATAMMGGFSP